MNSHIVKRKHISCEKMKKKKNILSQIIIYIYIISFLFFSTPFSLLSVSFHPIPSFSVTLSPSPSLSLLAALFLCPYSPFYHYFLSFLSLVFNIYSFFILSFLLHFSFSLLIHFFKILIFNNYIKNYTY